MVSSYVYNFPYLLNMTIINYIHIQHLLNMTIISYTPIQHLLNTTKIVLDADEDILSA